MPTIIGANGFEIRILTNDHRPAHVHCFKGGKTAKIEIAGRPTVTSATMSYGDAKAALALVTVNLALLRRRWKKYHGTLR